MGDPCNITMIKNKNLSKHNNINNNSYVITVLSL